MTNVTISKEKLGAVLADVEQLVTDVEDLVEDADITAATRLQDVQEGKVEGKTEQELDEYLKKRGVKVD